MPHKRDGDDTRDIGLERWCKHQWGAFFDNLSASNAYACGCIAILIALLFTSGFVTAYLIFGYHG